MAYLNLSGIGGGRGAPPLHRRRGAAGHGARASRVLDRASPSCRSRFGPRNRALLAGQGPPAGQRSTPMSARTAAGRAIPPPTALSSPRSATSSRRGRPSRSRRRAPMSRSPTIAGPQLVVPGDQCALRPQCRERPLGQPLRRALRHRCHQPGSRRRPASMRRGDTPSSPVPRPSSTTAVPLAGLPHADAAGYRIENGRLAAVTRGGTAWRCAIRWRFAGWQGPPYDPTAILLRHNGLHIEIAVDRTHAGRAGGSRRRRRRAARGRAVRDHGRRGLGRSRRCRRQGGAPIATGSGLMRGDLVERFEKGGRTVERRLAPDRFYETTEAATLRLHGRALMLTRNVGPPHDDAGRA